MSWTSWRRWSWPEGGSWSPRRRDGGLRYPAGATRGSSRARSPSTPEERATMRARSKRQLAGDIDRLIEAIYYRTCAGVQIDIMDIGKVFAAGRSAALTGGDVQAAILAVVALVRKN